LCAFVVVWWLCAGGRQWDAALTLYYYFDGSA